MKCACGCLENALFLSKTVQLIPIIKRDTNVMSNNQLELKHKSNLKRHKKKKIQDGVPHQAKCK